MVEKVPMTAGGYAALGVELKKRQSEDRPRIIEHIAEARSHGDLSENAEYHAAKEEQSHNEGRIAEIAERVGYGSASTFSVAFTRHVGRPPTQYAREQAAA